MTDLAQVAAVTIDRSASLMEANDYMVARGVRSLFVASQEGHVYGLITTSDTLSERPVRVVTRAASSATSSRSPMS